MNKKTFLFVPCLLVISLISCQILNIDLTSQEPTADHPSPTTAAPSPENRREPIRGLAGKWQYFSESGTLYYDIDIIWNGGIYRVENCVGHNDVICEIKSQSWEGGILAWTNYYPNSGYTTTHTYISISGDTLNVARSGTAGEGVTIYKRAP
jgi:hypothetical protein